MGEAIDALIAFVSEGKALFEEIRHLAIDKDLINPEKFLSVNQRIGRIFGSWIFRFEP